MRLSSSVRHGCILAALSLCVNCGSGQSAARTRTGPVVERTEPDAGPSASGTIAPSAAAPVASCDGLIAGETYAAFDRRCNTTASHAQNGARARLSVPGTVNAALQQGDSRLPDDSAYDDFALSLTSGETVTIVVRGGASTSSPGSNLDMFTFLMRDGQEVTHDDDSAGNFNSRIIYTATESAEYVVRVTTYGGGLKTGDYSVQTWPGANPAAM